MFFFFVQKTIYQQVNLLNVIKLSNFNLLLSDDRHQDKVNSFNDLFRNQYTSPPLPEAPNGTLSSIEIAANGIGKIIRALSVSIAQGHEKISIGMHKLCELVFSELVYPVYLC